MSKFARPGIRPAVSSPIVTTDVSVSTHQGGSGFAREGKSELFLLAVTNFVSETTFYESASKRDVRFEQLVHQVTSEDPEWMQRFIPWLRDGANMRSASVVAAAEYLKARGDNSRRVIASALQRADEPAEMLAYWHSRYGRKLPMPLKRGIADAIQRLYTQRNVLKYDGQANTIRFADVIMLTHPDPKNKEQSDLFKYLLDAKYKGKSAEVTKSLNMIGARKGADSLSRDDLLNKPELLKEAGYTWENISGKGEMDAAGWEAAVPNMGVFALIRNLRNFDQAGISKDAVQKVIAKITSPEDIKRAKAFPMRFFQAYKAVESKRWKPALDEAMELTLQNVPALKGRTLILCDVSGSMFWDNLSAKSTIKRSEAAALFGAALAVRAEDADLYAYDDSAYAVPFTKGASAFSIMNKITGLGGGGTRTWDVVRRTFSGHDRVVILTDEQVGGFYGNSDPGVGVIPLVYVHNLAGYSPAQMQSSNGRYTFGGLSDASFSIMEMIEQARDGVWPWEQK